MTPGKNQRGQATVEMAAVFTLIVMPVTLGLLMVAQAVWTWSGVIHLTRKGAQYAATHCWQADGQNVMTYMQNHVPVNIDVAQFRTGGTAQINVSYFQRDPDSGQLNPFTCDGECSTACVPDAVTVSVTNYEFRRFVNFLHLQPVVMPSFPTSVAMQSAGCDPEQVGSCVP